MKHCKKKLIASCKIEIRIIGFILEESVLPRKFHNSDYKLSCFLNFIVLTSGLTTCLWGSWRPNLIVPCNSNPWEFPSFVTFTLSAALWDVNEAHDVDEVGTSRRCLTKHKPHSAQLLRLRPQGHSTDRRRRELSQEDYRTVIGKQESLGQRCAGVRSGVQETRCERYQENRGTLRYLKLHVWKLN